MIDLAFNVGPTQLSAQKLFLLAGPCVLEESDLGYRIASELKKISQALDIPLIFKASYRKANRTSKDGYRGPGLREGLRQLAEIRQQLDIAVVTDVHEVAEIELVATVVDMLQIPAFLCRQTFLIEAAAKTGKPINLKKGQFLAPWDMQHAIEKILACDNRQILVSERGASFGYNNLVVDFRSIPILSQYQCLVVFDATHSTQLPGAGQGETAGQREMVPVLVKAAVAAGCHGLFLEVHPEPQRSPSDRGSIYPLNQLAHLLHTASKIYQAVNRDHDE